MTTPLTQPTLLVPLGSYEQHGPHLPFETDTLIAIAWTGALAEQLEKRGVAVALGPALGIGASGEHQDFAGTLSMGTAALLDVLVEVARSAAASGYSEVVFVSGHGGNAQAMGQAKTKLVYEGHRIACLLPMLHGGDAHAGHTETSLLLFLHPERVRMDVAEAGNTAPLDELMPELRRSGLKAVTANGVLGDPTTASAEAGRRYFDELVSLGLRQISDLLGDLER